MLVSGFRPRTSTANGGARPEEAFSAKLARINVEDLAQSAAELGSAAAAERQPSGLSLSSQDVVDNRWNLVLAFLRLPYCKPECDCGAY